MVVESVAVGGPRVGYSGVVQSVETTSGGKRLRVFVARQGRANDLLLFPVGAMLQAGDKLDDVTVRPGVETDSAGRPLSSVVYWVDDDL